MHKAEKYLIGIVQNLKYLFISKQLINIINATISFGKGEIRPLLVILVI